jgi:integrase
MPKPARYLLPDERERVIKCQAGERYAKRNIAMFLVGSVNGFRACEIRNLKLSNIFDKDWKLLENCYINPEQTKGGYGGGYFYNVVKSVRKAILDYIEERKEHAQLFGRVLDLEEPLFASQKGGRYKRKPFHKVAIVNLFKHILLKAGLHETSAGRLSSHCMRVTFASDFNYKYNNPKYLQVLMRHKTEAQSLKYVVANPMHLKDCIKDVFK